MIIALLKYLFISSVAFSLLFVFNRYFFRQKIQLQSNRVFMLVATVALVCLPGLAWLLSPVANILSNLASQPNNWNLEQHGTLFYISKKTTLQYLPENEYLNLANVLIILYLSTVVRHGFEFVQKLRRIAMLKKTYPGVAQPDGTIFHYLPDGYTYFSFFNHIFIPAASITTPSEELDVILNHERTHVKFNHSVDILLVELIGVFFKFLPFYNYWVADLKEVHENMTDTEMLKSVDFVKYMQLLIHTNTQEPNAELANYISNKTLKRRLEYLANYNSGKLKNNSVWLSLPLIVLVLSILVWLSALLIFDPKTPKNEEVLSQMFRNYEVVSPYFTNKEINIAVSSFARADLMVEHPEICLQVGNFAKIYSPAEGVVSEISTYNNYGIAEHRVLVKCENNVCYYIKGLYKIYVKENDTIRKNDWLGLSGNNELIPIVTFGVTKNNKPINPAILTQLIK